MKCWIVGSTGMLGKALIKASKSTDLKILTDRIDITTNSVVERYVQYHKPDIIINASAYTRVDNAQTDQYGAFTVNCLGVENLAIAARNFDAKFIHYSTDYVFDGNRINKIPYTETDYVNPQTI